MPETMRAARFYNHHDLRVEDIPVPELKQGQVHIDVEWCGICGSDLHEYTKGPMFVQPNLIPLVQGHEVCGYVRSPPSGSSFKDGEAVMIDPRVLCQGCWPCKTGATHGCQSLGFVGGTVVGGYSERVAVEEKMLHRLPAEIPMEFAAVIEPLAVVHHAIKQTGVKDWGAQHVLILGAGPIGFALVLCLRAHGAKKIYISEPTAARQKQVAEYADVVINPISEDLGGKCMELTEGRGVDVVFDCAGVASALEGGFAAIRVEGTYMMVAIWEKPMTLPCWQFIAKHLTFKGTLIYDDDDFAEVIQMLVEGRMQGYEKMVTGRIQLEDIDAKGFKELEENRELHIKILVSPKPKALANSSMP